ncbi:MAG TPA: DUF5668 domain-containing protein [Candidatus Limnocylindria bacterium]|nr:DUF5668 domain-containing protein [Candidatus Limnocylindria bacterium]
MTTPSIALESPRRTPSIAFPLVLISLGLVFLLANAGYLSGISWRDVLQLWPVLLVLLGVDLLLRPRSMLAAVVVEVAIIGAALLYLAAGPALPGANSINTGGYTAQESVLRTGASSLSLTLGYGAGDLTVRAGATDAVMPSLVMVKSTHEDIDLNWNVPSSGAAVVDLKSVGPNDVVRADRRAWDVTVPSDMPVGLTLNLGAGDFDIDLSNVMVKEATINNGASNLELALPKPSGDVPITISTGASSVDLRVPAGVQYRVRVTGAMNSISGPEESSGYSSAADRLTISISAGVSSITVR